MARQVVIQNPVINSPFEEPKWHFRFDDEGITDDIANGRRDSCYFVPIAQPRKKGPRQLLLDAEWTKDRIEPNKMVNAIRRKLKTWREGRYTDDVTRITARLLEHWRRNDRFRRLFFCQIEAMETLIYITEVAKKYGDNAIENDLRAANAVTHILGVRAFGTQLLCEQVVGRGLRRRYEAEPNTLELSGGRGTCEFDAFPVEYAEVYGVPFAFIPCSGGPTEPKPPKPITRVRALAERIACEITFPQLLLLIENSYKAADHIYNAIVAADDGQKRLLPIPKPYDTVGSTSFVDFDTTRPVYRTDERFCHISHVVADTESWEQKMAQALEELGEEGLVLSYAKNHNLGFLIPHTVNGDQKNYTPDFIVRLDDGRGTGDPLNLIVEVSGQKEGKVGEEKAAKVAAARNLWVPAVNNAGTWGRWAFVEIADPWDAKGAIRAKVESAQKETPAPAPPQGREKEVRG